MSPGLHLVFVKQNACLQWTWRCWDRQFRAVLTHQQSLHVRLTTIWVQDRAHTMNTRQSHGGLLILVHQWTSVEFVSSTTDTSSVSDNSTNHAIAMIDHSHRLKAGGHEVILRRTVLPSGECWSLIYCTCSFTKYDVLADVIRNMLRSYYISLVVIGKL